MYNQKDSSFARKKLILIAQKMQAKGINQGKSGNLSIRITGGMLITPSSIPYEEMKSDDLIAIDLNGENLYKNITYKKEEGNKPSSEWKLHADILKTRPEINAILHCHSIHATAIACHGKGIPSFHYMTAIAGGSDIKCAPYETFGSKELSGKALSALENRYACLLAQHGQVAIAEDLDKALEIAIEVETLAHIYISACQLGEPNHINESEMKIVLKKFKEINYCNSKIGPNT